MDLDVMPLGIYAHIPFCSSNCEYCSFFKEKLIKSNVERFLDGIDSEIKSLSTILAKRQVRTVFWGGGSPSVLMANDILSLGMAFLNNISLKSCEWTVEISPSSIKYDKLLAMKDIGVNRVSIGVQSFNDETIKSLGRRQSANQVYNAYEMVRKCGFTNVNVDLIFACHGQELSNWQQDLDAATSLNPEHISTYCLTNEMENGKFKKNDSRNYDEESREIKFYEFTREYLNKKGFLQYEISNFSKIGYQCEHNLNTWKMLDWVGVGPSAASQLGNRRFQNAQSLDGWLNGEKINECELTEESLCEDAIIFGLRMNSGVNLAELAYRFKNVNINKYDKIFKAFVESAHMVTANNTIALTDSGRLLADAIAIELMDC